MTSTAELLTMYTIDFESVFDNTKGREVFHQYLKLVHNEAPFSFLCDIEKYMSYIGVEARYNAATKIMIKYLSLESNCEINIGNDARTVTLEMYRKCTEFDCPRDIFNDLRMAVYLNLKEVSFPSYLSSQHFLNYVSKMMKTNPGYLETIGSKKKGRYSVNFIEKKLDSTLYDPLSINITENEFNEVLSLVRSQDKFDLDVDSNRVIIGTSKQSKSLSTKDKKLVKPILHCCPFPFSPDEVYSAMYNPPFSKIVDEHLKREVVIIDKFDYGDHYAVLLHIKQQMPFPYQNRDFSVLYSVRKMDGGSIIALWKSIETPLIPEDTNYVRGSFVAGELFESSTGGFCKYTTVKLTDYSGNAGQALVNKINAKRSQCDVYFQIIRENCSESRLKKGSIGTGAILLTNMM